MNKSERFDPKFEVPNSAEEHLSPSGKYRLVVTKFTTGKNTWDYTQGTIYKAGSEEPIGIVQRNYSSFPFLFIEEHPKGSFLITGENYQGQTVIALETGQRADSLSKGTEIGAGFCWSSYTYNAEHQVLVVCGCHWACPYEFRFFDFSDPMSGWPELEYAGGIDDDPKQPVFNADGTITCFQSERIDESVYESMTEEEDENFDEEEARRKLPNAATVTLRREGTKLVLVNEWVSDIEQKRRIAREEADRKYKEWLRNYRTTDPLYLAMLEGIKDPTFNPDTYDGFGITYDTWCPEFKKQERRACRRILKREGAQEYTIDLEWAVETGPIKLVIFKGGNTFESKFFYEHSADSMRAAFAYAKGLVSV